MDQVHYVMRDRPQLPLPQQLQYYGCYLCGRYNVHYKLNLVQYVIVITDSSEDILIFSVIHWFAFPLLILLVPLLFIIKHPYIHKDNLAYPIQKFSFNEVLFEGMTLMFNR